MNIMKKIWSNLNLSSQRRRDKLYAIYPPDDFYEILERERARADRSNQSFSFVVFALDLHDMDNDNTQHLLSVLVSRIRISDEIGWFDRQIGLVLPDTPAEGAWKLIDDVCKELNRKTSSSFCTVYTYPFEKRSSYSDSEKLILARG